MEKWIVLQNCQTVGLANSLKLQFPGADIDAVDIWAYKSGMEKHDAKLDDYSRIIVHPEFLGCVDKKDSPARSVVIQGHLYVGDDLGTQPDV